MAGHGRRFTSVISHMVNQENLTFMVLRCISLVLFNNGLSIHVDWNHMRPENLFQNEIPRIHYGFIDPVPYWLSIMISLQVFLRLCTLRCAFTPFGHAPITPRHMKALSRSFNH